MSLSQIAACVLVATALPAAVLDARVGRVPLWLSIPAVIAAAVFCWWGALLGLATGMGVLAIAGARRMGGADILWSTAAGALSAPGMLLAWSALLITRAITQQLARPLMLPAVPILVAGGAIGLVTTGIAR